jgi:Asp-tRNA(Asn)/Glu-tRNA(Gln) amidotransferase A subunit family amidase
VTAREAVERALAVVDEWEPSVHAWAFLEPDRARAEADAVDARATRAEPGPLQGVVVGVKDIFDTADQPTEYGSVIYAGHQPRADAGVVAQVRTAGATVLGKTVTTELAVYTPGPTTNPHRVAHTPGGSSSGSAAAVATGMVDVALGSQTAGSVIRPASFCGVFGYKPTFGTVTTAGVKAVAPSLDTVGWFARDPVLLDRVRVALTGRAPAEVRASDVAPRLASVDPQAHADALEHAASAGASVTELVLPVALDGLVDDHPVVMAYEAVRALAWEWTTQRDQLSQTLQRVLAAGEATSAEDYDAVNARAARARAACDTLFARHDCDVLITAATTGEAPEGLGSTGDPRFARLWTLLGLPTVSVPGMTGPTGLPIGVQLVARHGADAELLACAAWLARAFPTARAPRL